MGRVPGGDGMKKITHDDVIRIALANPDCTVPPEALDALKESAQRGKRTKYGNVRCEFDGLKFDSKAEMARYGSLRLLQLTGHISALEVHPVIKLHAGIKYVADFRYIEQNRVVIEDVKGGKATQTAAFKIKWKQAQERYPEYDFRIVAK